ncbi:MAG: 23S rRNA (adenine(2503)-C(2))-methyltransferase RlmN [Rhodothermales bacterium]|nr:23S rRNA (adenine(2503)-C(2))-methyltransferase RlmN [Rhodothermales bacterium]
MDQSPLDLKTLTLPELVSLVESLGEPSFRAKQIFRWLHKGGVAAFDEMTNVPARLRTLLRDRSRIGTARLIKEVQSSDGTVKFLFELESGNRFETVLIPDFDSDGVAKRLTVCVSSQVGCAMGCTFCATGTMGFKENLSAGVIVDQVRFVDQRARGQYGRGVTNVVFMGMGEPLLNYDQVLLACQLLNNPDIFGLSYKRVTVSTVGLAKQIERLADDGIPASLAVSLHAPDDTKRSSIMPVNRSERTDLTALRIAIQHYVRVTGKRVTYEYCMFDGFNDSVTDAVNLARVASWAPSKVNLIMYNPVLGKDFQPTPEERLNQFIQVLVDNEVTVTVRRSRGQDIDAACGQLAASAG